MQQLCDKCIGYLKKDIAEAFGANPDTVDGVIENWLHVSYCRECGACGHDGCCSGTCCRHLNCHYYQHDYDWMVKELESLYNTDQGKCHEVINVLRYVYSRLTDDGRLSFSDIEEIELALKGLDHIGEIKLKSKIIWENPDTIMFVRTKNDEPPREVP